jgi:hypothetical protein
MFDQLTIQTEAEALKFTKLKREDFTTINFLDSALIKVHCLFD